MEAAWTRKVERGDLDKDKDEDEDADDEVEDDEEEEVSGIAKSESEVTPVWTPESSWRSWRRLEMIWRWLERLASALGNPQE